MTDTPIIAAGAGTLQCVIVTPERAVLDEPAEFVALPMFDGELGVAPGRHALIGRLGIGELRVKSGATTKKFYVDGGFAQVRANVVSVLTPKALPVEELKEAEAQQMLATARTASAKTPLEQEARARTQARARAQLRILGASGYESHG